MLYINYQNHDESYDCNLIVDLFYDKNEYEVSETSNESLDLGQLQVGGYDHIIVNRREILEDSVVSTSTLYDGQGLKIHQAVETVLKEDLNKHELRAKVKRYNKITLYEVLEKLRDSRSKWGTLVGIRPVKIAHEMLDKGLDFSDVRAYMKTLRVSEEKMNLVCDIAMRERPYVGIEELEDLSLYISIPFCPSRCHYCSFPSNDFTKKKRHIPAYLEAVISEVKAMADYLRSQDKYFDCIYIGGGTPSVLSADQMTYLLDALHEHIDFKKVKEFTYEAGRPDTFTKDKLQALRKGGVNRICVNPQTFNDETLVQIGRSHTADEFCNAFCDLKEVGFECVNFDLILGLAHETLNDMKMSIDKAIVLGPENITVHTLAVKRASQIKEFNETHLVGEKSEVELAIDYMYETMAKNDYVPYYMYRQKNMVGNLENVGFCKEGFEGLYNMRIMEERHTIAALGAGSVSKISFPEENRFERHTNPKGLEIYIEKHQDYLEKHLKALKLKFEPESIDV